MQKALLKPPGSLLTMLGPSLLFVALSLNGGEMLLWPNLVTNYSLTLLWFIPIILTLQWAVNVEISRATAYDGRFVLRELARFAPLRYFLLTLIVITLAWPAWISITASVLTFQFGLASFWTPLIGIVGLLMLLPAWKNKKYYNTLENIARIGLIVVFACVTSILVFLALQGNFEARFDNQFFVRNEDFTLLYAAVAYGGVAGILNFTQASWIRSKGYAGSVRKTDYTNQKSQTNFKRWMRFIARENFVLFWLGNLVGIFAITLVTVNILSQTSVTGFQLIVQQLIALAAINPFMEFLWSLGVICLFVMAQLTIMDAAGRLWVGTAGLPEEKKAKVSQYFVGIGIFILLLSFFIPSFRQPSFLLELSASMASFSFSFLPLLVVWYNRKYLPTFAQASWWQQALLVGCGVFYVMMTIIYAVVLLL